MDTVRDLLMLEAGIIPDSMDFRLPKKGMVCIYKEKIDYSYNKREQWEGLWDSNLIFQFGGLESYVENWVEDRMKEGKSPLEQIEERKKIALERNGGINIKKAEAIETLRSA